MKPLRFKLMLIAYFGILLLAPSCTCSNAKHSMPLPAASGRVGEVEVVADKLLWNSEVGEAIRTILTSQYPFLPQVEPSFSLVNIPPRPFSKVSIYQIHRNILLVEVDAAKYKEAEITVQKDVWASPQIVIKIAGASSEALITLLQEQQDQLWLLLEQAEIDRQSSSARTYADEQLKQLVHDKLGFYLSIPQGYHKRKPGGDPSDFIWFGYDTNYASMGIAVYSYPYADTAQLSLKVLNQKRQEFLEKYVPSSRKNSYMMTSSYVDPEFTLITYNGQSLGRLRGLWKVHNGYMGGPFVSYSMIVGNSIVTAEGFVYAPKTEKRNYIRQMIGILMTMVPDKQ